MLEYVEPEQLGWVFVFGICVALFMAFATGANDVANSFGSSLGSGALTYRQVVVIASVCEFAGASLMGSKVIDTIGNMAEEACFDGSKPSNAPALLMVAMLGTLIASAFWLFLATYLALPVSTTHSLVGAIVGSIAAIRGFGCVRLDQFGTIAISWVVSPVLSGVITVLLYLFCRRFVLNSANPEQAGLRFLPGFCVFTAFVLSFFILYKGIPILPEFPFWVVLLICVGVSALTGGLVRVFLVPIVRRAMERIEENHPLGEIESGDEETKMTMEVMEHKFSVQKAEVSFKWNQVITACLASFAHGSNDTANAVGPLAMIYALYVNNHINDSFDTPFWVMALGGGGIVVGLATLGRRVMETMAYGLTTITYSRGFTIEVGTVASVVLASRLGLPVSTTHCKVGSTVAVGFIGDGTPDKKNVDLSLFRDILAGWLITVPFAAIIGAGFTSLMQWSVVLV